MAESTSPEGFKNHVNVTLGDMVCGGRGSVGDWLDSMVLKVLSKLFCDSVLSEMEKIGEEKGGTQYF